MKDGVKSTEFWLTLLSNLGVILGGLSGQVDPKVMMYSMAGINGLYATLRTIAKKDAKPV